MGWCLPIWVGAEPAWDRIHLYGMVLHLYGMELQL